MAVVGSVSNVDGSNLGLGELVYRDEQHVIRVSENTVITYSIDAPNPHYLEAWTRTVKLMAGRFHGGLAAITVIDSRARAPDDVSKAHIRNTVLRHAAELRAFAYVVEGEGFGAAAIRSALSVMSLAARYPFPMKVFGRVEEAVPWVLNRSSKGALRASDAAKLVTIANSLRAELPRGEATGRS